MKIEILPRIEGFSVLFPNGDPATVKKIKILSVALLLGMGYRLETGDIEKGDDLLFFNVRSSVGDRKLDLSDLFRALDGATKSVDS